MPGMGASERSPRVCVPRLFFSDSVWSRAQVTLLSGFLGGSVVKNPPASARGQFQSLGQEDPLEEEMATYSSILLWRIPWTEEPNGLQSLRSQSIGHNLETKQ